MFFTTSPTSKMLHKVNSSEYSWFEISFPSLRLVAIQKLKSSVCFTIGEGIDGSCLFQVKWKVMKAINIHLKKVIQNIVWKWISYSFSILFFLITVFFCFFFFFFFLFEYAKKLHQKKIFVQSPSLKSFVNLYSRLLKKLFETGKSSCLGHMILHRN